MTTKTITEVEQLRLDVLELRTAVDDMRAELDQRDLEQVAVENAILFLQRQVSTLRGVLGRLAAATFGTTKTPGKEMHDRLYPEPIGDLPNLQAPVMVFEQPSRRWTQFGTKAELVEKAIAHKVPGARSWSRKHLVMQLWDRRALPGSVALIRRDFVLAEETAQ